MLWILAICMGVLVGLSLGMFGSGGSVLAVPILIYILGYETKTAIAMALAIVALSAWVGAIVQWKRGNLCHKAALFFSAVGIVGTLFGAWVALKISSTLQLALFGSLMLFVAVAMFLKKENPLLSEKNECEMRPDLAGGLGAGVGFLTGLLGVGGGFLIVPSLNTLGHLKLRLAIGTSLLIIALNSSIGVFAYWGKVSFHWPIVLIFGTVASLSSFLGVFLAQKLPVKKLKNVFSTFILILGAWILLKNLFFT